MQQLNEFSECVRSGLVPSEITLSQDKMSLYHSLIMCNMQEVIQPCFPVLKSLLCEATWQALALDFLQKTKLSTPLFHKLPYEFVIYLQNNPVDHYPFAAELAHYEWIELELELAQSMDKEQQAINSAEPLNVAWQLSSCARLLAYDYDVHNISCDYLPNQQIPTYLAVYQANDVVHFMSLNELSFQLLQCILAEEVCPLGVIQNICDLYPQLNQAQLQRQIETLLIKLSDEGIILSRREN